MASVSLDVSFLVCFALLGLIFFRLAQMATHTVELIQQVVRVHHLGQPLKTRNASSAPAKQGVAGKTIH